MSGAHEYRQELLDLMRNYRQSQVLITCAELGIFSALGHSAANAADLAGQLEVNPLALVRLLNAAVGLGLLEKENEVYRVNATVAQCLSYDSPYYLGNLIKREGAFYRRWSNLSQAVRTGQRPPENSADEHDPHWVRNFELALYDAARTAAPAVATSLGPLLGQPTEARRVIDVGGGHGAYSIALAEHYPNLQAVVFELPAAAEVAREIIAASPVAERVTALAGDFKLNELAPDGANFDMALLFGILVSETAASAKALLGKVYNALVPGGWLVIRGFYLDATRSGPLEATLADLHMLLSTEAGGTHTLEELTNWLEETGFGSLVKLALPAPERSELILAQKPAI